MFEDAQFEAAMYNIDPSLTCRCDEVHVCQQCIEDVPTWNPQRNKDGETDGPLLDIGVDI